METSALSPPSNDGCADLLDASKAANIAPVNALTPPTSEDMNTKLDDVESDLSDIDMDEEEEDNGEEVVPDHYYDGGKIPVFKPTMEQFRSFKKYIDKIDKYGMKSGIVKVIPPPEWREAQPPLDELVKTIKIKNPIMQEFMGTHGTYTQANIEKQRSYNLPEWKALTEEPSNQPPARRGERRRNQEKVVRGGGNLRSRTTAQPAAAKTEAGGPKRRGRPRKNPLPAEKNGVEEEAGESSQIPPTPISPATQTVETVVEETPTKPKAKPRGRPPKGGQAKSVSSRRMNNISEKNDLVDEAAFEGFDYHMDDLDEFTAERCAELETAYWKSLTFAQPMYAADMPGSLFKDDCTVWNVAKLENLLDVLGTKVPGVNTAYLYMGMWKATFAWHLEDVDLYSINYIHFGAPKQWYSISQEDARKFEAAMRKLWPNDSKNCDQFLRHKTYLISPETLQKQFGIKVNKLVHHEGEFVITYPYGYHSGYNIGYNCAESVNFATEAWLDYGRIARKCDCEADSVWVDVADIERKLRGEPTPEYYEETEDDDEDDTKIETGDLPSPPASVAGKPKTQPRKRKRDTKEKEVEKKKKKRIRIRVKGPTREPCILCPNDVAYEPLLPTDNGRKAHRACALYTPETWVTIEDGIEKVHGVTGIDRARLELKCNFCRSKRGACFQCASKKCTRAFHATCAMAAGVQIDAGMVPTFGEDGTEYYEEGFDFRCRFHRPKRAKNVDVDALESSKLVNNYAKTLKTGDVLQVQYPHTDVFGGVVVENRPGESTVLIDVLPEGDRIEVEWKWIAVLDPHDSQRPKPSSSAIPMPEGMNKKSVSIENRQDGVPNVDEPFTENSEHKWAQFMSLELPPQGYTRAVIKNRDQVQVDLNRPDQLFFYLPQLSTESKCKFADDPKSREPSAKGDFMERVKPAAAVRPLAASYGNPYNMAAANARMNAAAAADRPYIYKPKIHQALSNGHYNDQHANADQRNIVEQANRRPSYPHGSSNDAILPPLRQQISEPSRLEQAPLRPFPGDAYYSSRVLPAALPGQYSAFSEQVRRNSVVEGRPPFGMQSHSTQPSSGPSPQNDVMNGVHRNPYASSTAHASLQGSMSMPDFETTSSRSLLNDVLSQPLRRASFTREEPSVTKTLPQLPAPVTAGPHDMGRRSSVEWTPPSRTYQSMDRSQFPPYQTPPQYSARPQPTYQTPQEFQTQIGIQSQRPSIANRYGAYERTIRDMAAPKHSAASDVYSSTTTAGGAQHGFVLPQQNDRNTYESPKAPTPSPLSDARTPDVAHGYSPQHWAQAPMAGMTNGSGRNGEAQACANMQSKNLHMSGNETWRYA